jgi:hypothetical protein
MLAFEIYQNGKRLCTAGTGTKPVISVLICTSTAPGEEDVRLLVGGMRGEEHVSWHSDAVQVGDEVSVRVAEMESVDEPRPLERQPPSDEEQLEDFKNYIRLAAKELGWKLQE